MNHSEFHINENFTFTKNKISFQYMNNVTFILQVILEIWIRYKLTSYNGVFPYITIFLLYPFHKIIIITKRSIKIIYNYNYNYY